MKLSFTSFICSLVSLLMQMSYTKYLIEISDYSALMDTQPTVVLVSVVLVSVTALLNGIIFWKYFRKR